MKIFLISNHNLCLPMVQALEQAQFLTGLACNSDRLDLVSKASSYMDPKKILKISNTNWEHKIRKSLKRLRPDIVFVMTFKHKIPATLFNLAKLGFINFHPGPLPQYRGPDPVFWQIKNREPKGTLTLHKMDAQFDSGAIVSAGQFPISDSMTHSRFMSECGMLAVQLVSNLLQVYNTIKEIPSHAQNSAEIQYLHKPKSTDLLLSWQNNTAADIIAHVNACNASYGGAITYFRNQPLQVLQVSICKDLTDTDAGKTLSITDAKGWNVASKDGKVIKIDVVQSAEGIMTGLSFAKMAQVQNGESLS